MEEQTRYTRSFNQRTTSFACFDLIRKRTGNFEKWSITWHTQLNSPSDILQKSIRSIYKSKKSDLMGQGVKTRVARFPVQALLDARSFLGIQACYKAPGELWVEIVETQWLASDEWDCPIDNDPKLAVR